MARINKINTEFGVSQATGPNTWLKATAGMEIEFDTPEDQQDKEAIWESSWERVTEEVAKQMKKFGQVDYELNK